MSGSWRGPCSAPTMPATPPAPVCSAEARLQGDNRPDGYEQGSPGGGLGRRKGTATGDSSNCVIEVVDQVRFGAPARSF